MTLVERPLEETARSRFRGMFWILGLLAAVIGGVILFKSRPASAPETEPFEIESFYGRAEIAKGGEKTWRLLERGMRLESRDSVRTGAESDIDIAVPGKIHARLKPDSQLDGKAAAGTDKTVTHQLHLLKGTLLASTAKEYDEEKGHFVISTPVMITAVRTTVFYVSSQPEEEKSWVGVLRGAVEVGTRKRFAEDKVTVHSLQKSEVQKDKVLKDPVPISRDEWNEMKEAYELMQRSAAEEAAQLDLAKQAGSLLDKVYDHGTFYTPKVGFADRRFVRDKAINQVHLDIEYDVFPRGSYVGFYMKTRDFDLADFDGFQFEAQRAPEESFPEEFRIELKSKHETVRAFAPKNFKKFWELYRFDFQANKPTPVHEITFVFYHEKVGEQKKGEILLKNIHLIPASEETRNRVRAYLEKQEARKSAAGPQASAKKPTPTPKPSAPPEVKKVKLSDIAPAQSEPEKPAP